MRKGLNNLVLKVLFMKSLEHPGLKLIIYGALLQIAAFIAKGVFGLIFTLVGIVLVVVGLIKVMKKVKK